MEDIKVGGPFIVLHRWDPYDTFLAHMIAGWCMNFYHSFIASHWKVVDADHLDHDLFDVCGTRRAWY